MTISDTQRSVLAVAAQHAGNILVPPTGLPPAARSAIARALLQMGLADLAEGNEADLNLAWKHDGRLVALRITEAGHRAIGARDETAAGTVVSPAFEIEVTGAETAVPLRRRPGLRQAGQAVIAAWDIVDNYQGLSETIESLRAALMKPAPAPRPTGPRKPRQGIKQDAVLALLRRPEGASGPQLTEATGWAPHTVRGFLAGLARKGITIEVLERVRQIGPNQAGATGSFTVYRIVDAG
jgi:hypothetical protein